MASALSEAEVDILNNMKEFVFGYNKKLADIREVLSETISEAWNSENDLIQMNLEPYDNTHIISSIHSENVPLKKVITVFGVLISEMKSLKQIAEAKFYGPLSMYGHSIDIQEDPDADDRDKKAFREYQNRTILPMEQQMGEFLPVLQDLVNFTKRVNSVVRNILCQLACLFHERMKLYVTTFKHVEFDYVFEALGELCTVLNTIDLIIADNNELQEGWLSYKRMMKYVRSDPERYHADDEKLAVMEQLLVQIDERVMSNSSFATLLAQDMSLPDTPGAAPGASAGAGSVVSGNRVLAQVFTDVVSRMLLRLKAGLAEPLETYERTKFVDTFGLYALFRALFNGAVKVDMKLFKAFWETQLKVPLVCVFGRSCWMPADFLVKYAPAADNSSLKPPPKQVLQTRRDILAELDTSFQTRVNSFHAQMCVWMVRMEGELLASQEHNAGALLNARAKLLLHGVLLANQIKNTVLTAIHLRLALDVGFQSRNVRALCTCLELLKAIEHTYRRRLAMISENMQHMLGQTTFALKKILNPLKDKLERRDPSAGKLNDTKADIHAALALALDLLDMPPTFSRRVVVQLCVAIAQMKQLLKANFEEEVRYQLWKLERLSACQQYLANATDCSFVYWVSNIVPVLMRDVVEGQVEQCNKLQYLFHALRDCSTMLHRCAVSPAQAAQLVPVYQAEVRTHFKVTVVLPVAREVETDLRLYIHSIVLKQAQLHRPSSRDLTRVLDMKPLRLFDELVSVREQVTHILDTTFYNLNTVALHDGRVYSEMRNLARTKYGLPMLDTHLPGTAHYSEALDVLEIMRNIHVFVARYNYNLNSQIFIERAVDQKHLNVIDVDHIAASIRTHGAGIMNTTVNFTYQFLCRKLMLISEFLFDDHIKSPLLREMRFFKQEKDKLNNMYPYSHAEQLAKDIRKLGVSSAGLTYLDQLRMQITETGNALGYVRTVRSSGLRHSSLAVQFVPDLQEIKAFRPLVTQSQLGPEAVLAAETLDRVAADVAQGVAEGADYFYVLVEIFGDVFAAEEHAHMRGFYAILPALTLSFVDAMLAKKEKLHKRSGRAEACFTDDGFALGIAYLLRLLNQDAAFDAMHWFDSVMMHLKGQRETLQQQAATASKSRGKALDAEHALLNLQRVEALVVEFELLNCALAGSRVFFRDMDAVNTEPEPTTAAQDGASSATATATTTASTAAPSLTDIPQAPDLAFFL